MSLIVLVWMRSTFVSYEQWRDSVNRRGVVISTALRKNGYEVMVFPLISVCNRHFLCKSDEVMLLFLSRGHLFEKIKFV